MSFQNVVLMMKFNLKDIVIMLEMLVIAVMYFSGTVLTVRRRNREKRAVAKILNGSIYAEFAIVLFWVIFAIQI